jgi:hypothetical protein
MNQENFNDVVYKDEELSFDRKIELLEMCRADYDEKLRVVYKEFSPLEKTEMLHLITSAQLFILNKFTEDKNDETEN